MMYRVNYSNGQVSKTFETKHEAFAHIEAMDQYQAFAFVEFYDPGTADAPGDWFRIAAPRGGAL
jgi:hypothetical protein